MTKDQTYKTKVMQPEEVQARDEEKIYSFPTLGINVKAVSLQEAYEKVKDLTSNQN